VEIKRSYRARLKAAGKVVRLVDADFDPGQMQALVVELRDNLKRVSKIGTAGPGH
jgi:hypothetical protein